MKNKLISKLMACIVVMSLLFNTVGLEVFALNTEDKYKSQGISFTINPSSKTYNGNMMGNSTYNENTKHYYLIRSYLEELERQGGGTLVLEEGVYNITNTLYVPSNVKLILKNNVTIKKSNETGIDSFPASSSIFQFISPSKSGVEGSATGYKGEANISFIGEGNATIDLNGIKDTVGIVMGHNKNILIDGITFKNMYYGNYLRIGASSDITIQNSKFIDAKASDNKNRESINLINSNKNTSGWSYKWSGKDGTVNKNILIQYNEFDNLDRAIGSSKYVPGVYHQNIKILNNNISNISSDAIRVLNWENSEIKENEISNIDKENLKYRGIVASGAKNPMYTNNNIKNSGKPMQFLPYKEGSLEITYNELTQENIEALKNNSVENVIEEFIRINYEYNNPNGKTDIIHLKQSESDDFTITPDSKTYGGLYLNNTNYNDYTKHYYLIRSYLEALEKSGGGTLTLERGTYTVTNVLYVPSNTKIILKDGVTIKKGTKTGITSFEPSKTMFQFIRPSKSSEKGVYGKYDGEKNISIIGEGSATIDLNYFRDSAALIIGHNQNIKIENIKFMNMNSAHFIEIDATKNINIKNNEFVNSKPSENQTKEAINIDTPDKLTGGFPFEWSKQDSTPNYNVTIENNRFYDLDRAVGTHNYSENKYHTNVVIRNNTFDTTRKDTIRIMNWKDTVIENNTIKNVDINRVNEGSRGILASGAINPTIKNNIFENSAKAMQFMPAKNSGDASIYDITYNEISTLNKEDLKNNRIKNIDENFIRINSEYDVFDKNTEKVYFNRYKNIPVINANNIDLALGEKFDPMNHVKATDKEDGDITKNIKVLTNTVNTKVQGKYKVVYEVMDSDGNSVTKEIVVRVDLLGFKTIDIDKVNDKSTEITGRVEKGLSGVTAKALVGNKQIGKTVKADANGEFKIEIPSQKIGTEITVKVYKVGYDTGIQTIKVEEKTWFNNVEIDKIHDKSTEITGRVEKGLSGVTAKALVGNKQIGKTVKADANGEFKIEIPSQKIGTIITVKVYKVGYTTSIETIKVQEKTWFDNVELDKVNDKSTEIIGRVEKGLYGVTAKALVGNKQIGKTVKADVNGEFKIEIPSQKIGTIITLKVYKAGYTTGIQTIKVEEKTWFNRVEIDKIHDKSTEITGRVEKGLSGVTAKALVGNKQIGKTVKADANGEFKIEIPSQKIGTTITVKVYKAGYTTSIETIQVQEKTWFDKIEVDKVNDKSTEITGRVEKGLSGVTAKVLVENKQIGKTVKADENGEFKIEIPSQKVGTTIIVKVYKSGYTTGVKSVVI